MRELSTLRFTSKTLANVLAAAIFVFCLSASTTYAATFTVTNTNDSGPGSLRQAILDAFASAGANTINFSISGTITLGSTLPGMPDELTIDGDGQSIIIGGNNSVRVLFVSLGTSLHLKNLTIANGSYPGEGGGILNHFGTLNITNCIFSANNAQTTGGAIFNRGTLTVSNSTISGNSAGTGGGIFNTDGGTMTVTNSTLSGNSAADGGGMANQGSLTISRTTISNNAARFGGGIHNVGQLSITASNILNNRTWDGESGPAICVSTGDDPPPPGPNPDAGHGGGVYNRSSLLVESSLFAGNTTGNGGYVECGDIYGGWAGHGGAIGNETGTVVIRNSTFNGNRTGKADDTYANTGGRGGNGAAIYSDSSLSISNTTIDSNSVGHGGVGSTNAPGAGSVFNASNAAGSLELISSIVANTNIGNDVQGLVSSGDYNLVETSSGVLPGANNIIGVNPMLAPLQDNGGPTKTHALLPGSPAINAGSNPNSSATDQRGTGFDREVGSADIGAFEVQPACSGVSFAPAINFPAGIGTQSVAVVDVNQDGNLDMVSANQVSDTITVFLGSGTGAFAAGVSFATGDGPQQVATGDFNSDGRLDLATPNQNSGNVSVLLGNGLGGFSVPTNFTTETGPQGIAAADLNGDGRLDLSVTNITSDSVSILLGNGAGGFAPAMNLSPGDSPRYLAVDDFNNDSKLDLAVTVSPGSISILLGDGTGGFNVSAPADPGTSVAFGVTSADLDGDGNTDLATSSLPSNTVSVMFGDGSGSFSVPTLLSSADGAFSISPADFNGDGLLDLITTNQISDNVSIFLSDGGSGFAPAVNFGVDDAPRFASTGDFNGDGKIDVAVANVNSGNVSILLNSCSSNSAPVAENDSRSTDEDTELTGSSVLANDTDGETDALTAILVNGPSNAASFTLNTNGTFDYTPNANFNGTDSFTYKANDGSLDSNVATVTITVNPVNDQPVVSATPLSQNPIQYSDAITTINVSASDVETPAANLVAEPSWDLGGDAIGYQPGLPNGMVLGGTGGAWTISGVAAVPKGTYTIRFNVRDTGDGSSAPRLGGLIIAIGVSAENAVAAPKLTNPVSKQVSSPGGTASGSAGQICFDITEPADGSPGNTALIESATVTINAVGGGSGAGTISKSGLSWSGGGVGGTRTACVTLTLANTPANVYEVILDVGGDYYTGSGTTVFTVFDPSAGFASGGGWIINPISGYRANYGVHMKYAKNGTVQGSVLYVEHRPDGDYKVKSTALAAKGAFSIIPITGGAEAQMTGKAAFGPDGATVGNHGFIVRLIDKGTPGTYDQFGLKLINPSGQVLTSFTFDPVLLGGGNNQVPKK